jgi:hypothetical protein
MFGIGYHFAENVLTFVHDCKVARYVRQRVGRSTSVSL